MKLFTCGVCGNTLYFENVLCGQCGHSVGYLPRANKLIPLERDGDVYIDARSENERYVYCANAQHDACNWLVPATSVGGPYCLACRHNETVPPLDNAANLNLWQVIERAKKRLFYSLLRLQLPLATRDADSAHGLQFRFLAEDVSAAGPVMTGHDNGTITIALIEADDAEREKRRTNMGEPYRTLLGHFRHEIGHHYWDLLVGSGEHLEAFRSLFGDERADYSQSLERHYADGAPPDWSERHISAYATAHPWEDFAETWAHYLHMVDAVETGTAFNVGVKVESEDSLEVDMHLDPYRTTDFGTVAQNWVPLTLLLNELNRAIGHADAYPFVLTPVVLEKLSFIHSLVHGARAHG